MLIVGLTGGIGCGKSLIAELFSQLNVTVIDSDQIARQLVQPSQPAFIAIQKKFGDKIASENQGIDRKKLRELIFKDPLAKEWLEKLLHPFIEKEIKKMLASLNEPYVMVVIPLLFETKQQHYLHRILVVDCPEELQIQRVLARDHISMTQVIKIIASQLNRKTRLELADDVIHNEGDLENLKDQVKKLHQKYLALAT